MVGQVKHNFGHLILYSFGIYKDVIVINEDMLTFIQFANIRIFYL